MNSSARRHLRNQGTSSTLPDKLHQRLNAYTIAACAAGVATLAGTLPADAKVIYTPVNVQIAPHHHFLLDLNHDGIADFVITNNVFQSIDIGGRTLLAKPLVANNAVAGFKGLHLHLLCLRHSKQAQRSGRRNLSRARSWRLRARSTDTSASGKTSRMPTSG